MLPHVYELIDRSQVRLKNALMKVVGDLSINHKSCPIKLKSPRIKFLLLGKKVLWDTNFCGNLIHKF